MSAIHVDFSVGGLKHVHEAFASVAAAQKKLEKQIQVSASNAQRIQQRQADAHVKTHEKAMRDKDRIVMNSAKMAGRLAAKQAADERRAEDAKVKAAERSALAVTRSAERAAKASAAAEKRALEDGMRAREVFERRKLQLQLNSARMTGKLAADSVREEMAARKRFTGGLGNVVGNSIKGTLGTVGKAAGGLLALGGGFSAADAVQSQMRNEGAAAQLSLNSGGALSKQQILSQSSDIASSLGTSTESVIAGLDAFVAKSGDAESGLKSMRELVELATATGADLGELSTVAGQAQKSTRDWRETMDMMREIAGMGRAGSVDVRELTQYGSRIFAGAEKFVDKRQATRELGAITQAAAATGGATGAAEASEAAPHLAGDIFKHEGAFKAYKIDVRDKKNPQMLRSIKDIIRDSVLKTGGDQGKLFELFGERSIRGVNAFSTSYNRATGGKTDKASIQLGIDAINKQFKEFEDAGLKDAQVKEEAAKRIQEADKQLEMTLNRLREAIGTQLLPEMIKLIPEIRRLIPEFAKLLKGAVAFAEWFAKNPLAGLGGLVLAAVTKDLAMAGIGAAVKAALVALMTGAPAAGAGAGGAATVATAGGAAVAGAVGIGAAVGVVGGGVAVEYQANKQLEGQRGGVGSVLTNSNFASDIGAQPNSEKKLNMQRALISQIQADIAKTSEAKDSAGPGALTTMMGAVTGRYAEVKEAHDAEQRAYATNLKELNELLGRVKKSLQENETALKDHTLTTTKVPPPATTDPARNGSMATPGRK